MVKCKDGRHGLPRVKRSRNSYEYYDERLKTGSPETYIE